MIHTFQYVPKERYGWKDFDSFNQDMQEQTVDFMKRTISKPLVVLRAE